MKKNVALPKLRIESELYEKMNKAIAMLNQNEAGISFSLPDFRRMAYKNFAERLLVEGLDISFKINGTK